MTHQAVEAFFLKAYDEHNDAIFRYCYYRVFNRELALELTQETFCKTWKSLAEGSEIKNLRAFLYRVAKNLVIDNARKRREESLEQLQEQGFEPGRDERQKLMTEIDARAAIAQIKSLDDIYREALLLRYVDGFSPREIAVMLDETPNVVSVRINRGLKLLRTTLESAGEPNVTAIRNSQPTPTKLGR